MSGHPESIDEAIRQLVNLGANDPLEIVEKLDLLYGREWVLAQLIPLAAEMGRRELGRTRRGAELALKPGDPIAQSQMRIAKFWVPTAGGYQVYKALGKVTPEDLEARAAWYERFADGALRRATWCRQVAELMRSEGVAVLSKLKADLPSLPDMDAKTLGA